MNKCKRCGLTITELDKPYTHKNCDEYGETWIDESPVEQREPNNYQLAVRSKEKELGRFLTRDEERELCFKVMFSNAGKNSTRKATSKT